MNAKVYLKLNNLWTTIFSHVGIGSIENLFNLVYVYTMPFTS